MSEIYKRSRSLVSGGIADNSVRANDELSARGQMCACFGSSSVEGSTLVESSAEGSSLNVLRVRVTIRSFRKNLKLADEQTVRPSPDEFVRLSPATTRSRGSRVEKFNV